MKPSKRTFTLTLPGLEVVLKGKGQEIIKITHLREVWDLCRKDGVNITTLTKRDDKTHPESLHGRLGVGSGPNYIVEKMRILEIHCIGDESTLEARSLESLHRHFCDSHDASVLLDYIGNSATDTNAVTCYTTATHLQKLLRPECQTWTQYLINAIHGRLDCRRHAQPPGRIVCSSSRPGRANRKASLGGEYPESTPSTACCVCPPHQGAHLPSAILRLALHLKRVVSPCSLRRLLGAKVHTMN